MPLPTDILERGKALGLDIEAVAGQDPAEVATFLGEVEKAAAEAGDDDGDPEDEGGDPTVKSLIALLGKAFAALTPGRVRKDESGDGDDEDDDEEEPENIIELRKSLEATQAELETERTKLRVDGAMATLKAAVKDHRMTPATAEALEPVVEHLAKSEAEHVEKSEDGKKQTTSMAELVVKAATHDREVLEPLFVAADTEAKAGEKQPVLWAHLKEKAGGNGSGENN